MIPVEQHHKFSQYLHRVYLSDTPIAGEMNLLCFDGSQIRVFGWVSKHINANGEEEFQSAWLDITDRYQSQKASENQRYLNALMDVYDKIFEFCWNEDTVKCVFSEDESHFKEYENIAVKTEDALNKWLIEAVVPEQQENVRQFFLSYLKRSPKNGRPYQIDYQAFSKNRVKQYTGLFIKQDDSTSYFCCREIKNANAIALKKENDYLRNLIMQFSDGIAAFEVSTQMEVKPLYYSENVYRFFGYKKDDWMKLAEKFTPLESFVQYSDVSYEQFVNLLKEGESQFTYTDYKTQQKRVIKAICSEKDQNSHFSRFVMLYQVDMGMDEYHKQVSIRTFGYFDVFVDGTPIAFRNQKSKELFALLVDRRGGFVSSQEAISFLWEDEPVNTITLARYRKVALRLKNTLEEYGISDVIEAVQGKRRIVMGKVDCDLYNYLSRNEEYAHLFNGNYLTNYSWAEMTLAALENRRNEGEYE